jgi:hypothetical protein
VKNQKENTVKKALALSIRRTGRHDSPAYWRRPGDRNAGSIGGNTGIAGTRRNLRWRFLPERMGRRTVRERLYRRHP